MNLRQMEFIILNSDIKCLLCYCFKFLCRLCVIIKVSNAERIIRKFAQEFYKNRNKKFVLIYCRISAGILQLCEISCYYCDKGFYYQNFNEVTQAKFLFNLIK